MCKTLIGAPEAEATPTSVQLLNQSYRDADAPLAWLLKGEPRQGGHTDMKPQMYKIAFTATVVAVYVQGLGAGLKWF
jgi:hypothetical protein